MPTPVANSVALTGDVLKDPLIQGSSWTFSGARVLTYSLNINFDDSTGQLLPGPGGPWTAPFSNAFTRALGTWSNVANISFSNISSGTYFFESTADIAAALTGNDLQQLVPGAAALGFFPDPAYATQVLTGAGITRADYPRPEGDVLLDNFHPVYAFLNDGGVGYWTMIHEIGHALGLKHSFDDGGNGRPTFAGEGLPQYDNERYTVMSYSGVGNVSASGHAATPMPLDILAIQQIYGANTTYRTGNDTYAVVADGAMRTIWDAGGTDTLDAGSRVSGLTLDLRPGALMDLGGGAVLGIAYNCTIENAIGGAGSDTLYGNAGNNVLTGGGGTNTYYGGTGNDTYVVSSAADIVNESLGEGTDTVLASVSFSLGPGIETLTLTGSGNINGTGGMGTLRINGNSGNNVLDDGNGASTMAGGAGNDTYIVRGPFDTLLENPGEGTDSVTLTVVNAYVLPDNIENLVLDSPFGFIASDLSGNALPNMITGSIGNNRIDGGAGADTLTGGGGADTYVVDQPGDIIVETFDAALDGVESMVSWTLGPTLENLLLAGAGAIDGTGNALANVITGNGAGNLLDGKAGNDLLVGAGGLDTAVFSGNRAAYTITRNQPAGEFNVVGPDGSDRVAGIEQLRFADATTLLASLATDAGIVDGFNAYRYLDSNLDLLNFYGPDTGAGLAHFLNWGFNEGRGFTGFDAYRYLASNLDLLGFYGANTDGAAEHFARWGYAEGRSSLGFDAYRYLASNLDLLAVYGSNTAGATEHFVRWGYAEGRSTAGFDAYRYLASNADLLAFYGANTAGATEHYVRWGVNEGRPLASFDSNQYFANYADLAAAFGNNTAQAAFHFVNWGRFEGRTDLRLVYLGTAGDDSLTGNAAFNTLAGGLGNDTLTGGAGADSFVFNSALNGATNRDTVTDFVAGTDRILLDDAVFTALVGVTLAASNLVSGTSPQAGDGNDFLLYNTATGALSYDPDGNGGQAAIAFATLTSLPGLTFADFSVV